MIHVETIQPGDRNLLTYTVGAGQENQAGVDDGRKVTLPSHDKAIYTFFHDGRIIQLATQWLRALVHDPRISDKTARQYAKALKPLFMFLERRSNYQGMAMDSILAVVSRKDLQDWISTMQNSLAPATVRNREVIAKGLIDWLCTDEGGNIRTLRDTPYRRTLAHPDGKLISPNPPPGVHQPIPINHVLIPIIKGFHNECERCACHFVFDTGARASELEHALKRDLPDERDFPPGLKYYPLVLHGAKGQGGLEKPRIVMLSAPVLARIRRYHKSAEYRFSPYFDDERDPDKPMFLGVNGQPLKQANFLKQFKSAVARQDLNPKDFWTHLLRHGNAFSILMSDMGKDYFDNLFLAMVNLGHQRVETTQIYTRVPPAFLQALSGQRKAIDRWEEARQIDEATFLSPGKHKERRGHRDMDDE